jgi:enamine deaminase RidA (YjgF/YER057c/UK114 family)
MAKTRGYLRPKGVPDTDRTMGYSYGIRVGDTIWVSGQVAKNERNDLVGRDDATAQAEQCFRNIATILADAGLGLADIVRVNAYVTAREHMKGYMSVRDRMVGNPPPASTLMIVSGFTRPEFLVEIEVVAADRPK